MQTGTSTGVVVLIAVLAFAGGFAGGMMFAPTPLGTAVKVMTSDMPQQQAQGDTASPQSRPEGTIDIGARLSADQRAMAQKFGLDPTNLYLTPTGRTCVEAKLGKARVDAIVGGESPTTMEMMSALPCLSQ